MRVAVARILLTIQGAMSVLFLQYLRMTAKPTDAAEGSTTTAGGIFSIPVRQLVQLKSLPFSYFPPYQKLSPSLPHKLSFFDSQLVGDLGKLLLTALTKCNECLTTLSSPLDLIIQTIAKFKNRMNSSFPFKSSWCNASYYSKSSKAK